MIRSFLIIFKRYVAGEVFIDIRSQGGLDSTQGPQKQQMNAARGMISSCNSGFNDNFITRDNLTHHPGWLSFGFGGVHKGVNLSFRHAHQQAAAGLRVK